MKKVIVIISALSICFVLKAKNIPGDSQYPLSKNYCQAPADTTNIKQMVAAQIEAARKKEIERAKSASKTNLIESASETKIFGITLTNFKLPDVSKDVMLKGIGLLAVAVLLTVVIIVRRRRIKRCSKKSPENYKKRIGIIREEKPIKIQNPALSKIRTRLTKKPGYKSLDKNLVTARARELNISKGEILLAQKIRYHQLASAESN